jgi:GNAT superfamily N-acetyltransferase
VHYSANKGEYTLSTDPLRLDADVIHAFLRTSYWSPGIPREIVVRAIQGALCFGIYGPDQQQVGYARVITDKATFAYLADVFVLEAHRGKGLSKWLMECIMQHPELQGLRRWMLGTKDAHGLYAQYGFTPMAMPDRFMEIAHPDIYYLNRPSEG